jgi:hypothetical protein
LRCLRPACHCSSQKLRPCCPCPTR